MSRKEQEGKGTGAKRGRGRWQTRGGAGTRYAWMWREAIHQSRGHRSWYVVADRIPEVLGVGDILLASGIDDFGRH